MSSWKLNTTVSIQALSVLRGSSTYPAYICTDKHVYTSMCTRVNEKCRRKKEASKVLYTNNTANQHMYIHVYHDINIIIVSSSQNKNVFSYIHTLSPALKSWLMCVSMSFFSCSEASRELRASSPNSFFRVPDTVSPASTMPWTDTSHSNTFSLHVLYTGSHIFATLC